MIALLGSELLTTGAATREPLGPAALTTRACAPMGLGTGNSAAGRPPCRPAAAPLMAA
ncbi:MAG TPA: hypothetical protein VFA46_22820 [Actinomycetes bacterium]|jgi:hypothetical protein|nr:hypothetical protein [Actinomycetes bacterium]